MQTLSGKDKPVKRRSSPDHAVLYQICVEGRLEQKWADWFDGFTFICDGETTRLTGVVPDQAALYGLLARLRDLNHQLISVQRLEGPGG
jgi:hypothetical protein